MQVTFIHKKIPALQIPRDATVFQQRLGDVHRVISPLELGNALEASLIAMMCHDETNLGSDDVWQLFFNKTLSHPIYDIKGLG